MTAHARIGDYASKPVVRRTLEQARELGIEVAGFELAPGGVIRVFDKAAFPAPPKDEFEEWEQSGKLG